MNLSISRPAARLAVRPVVRDVAGAAVVALVCALFSAVPANASRVDDYADYEAQTSCTSTPRPGTEYLLRWLIRNHAHTGSSGTLRPCSSGGTSEHKDGRALDWAVDAGNPVQAAQAKKFLERAFASDRVGNRDALARRMGIMYLIWNDHMYSSYRGFEKRDYLSSGCKKLSKCSKTLRHRDHVHISLSHSGAAAQTSFYRARKVPSIPVLKPGTKQLDPEATARVKLTVPATGRTVTTGFKLTRGTTYRIVGDGLYRYGPGPRVADAACRWSKKGWTPSGLGVLVNGTSPWAGDCDGRHTRVAKYRARKTGFLRVRVGDQHPRGNKGELSFYILREDLPARSVESRYDTPRRAPRAARSAGARAKRLKAETLTLRAAAKGGARTNRSLRRNARYRVVVTGVARSGRTKFDGSCVRYAGRFRPQHSFDLTRPAADHLSVYVQGVKVDLRAPGTSASCSGSHRYVGSHKAVVRGKARVKVWDPFSYADNSGSLRVRLKRKA